MKKYIFVLMLLFQWAPPPLKAGADSVPLMGKKLSLAIHHGVVSDMDKHYARLTGYRSSGNTWDIEGCDYLCYLALARYHRFKLAIEPWLYVGNGLAEYSEPLLKHSNRGIQFANQGLKYIAGHQPVENREKSSVSWTAQRAFLSLEQAKLFMETGDIYYRSLSSQQHAMGESGDPSKSDSFKDKARENYRSALLITMEQLMILTSLSGEGAGRLSVAFEEVYHSLEKRTESLLADVGFYGMDTGAKPSEAPDVLKRAVQEQLAGLSELEKLIESRVAAAATQKEYKMNLRLDEERQARSLEFSHYLEQLASLESVSHFVQEQLSVQLQQGNDEHEMTRVRYLTELAQMQVHKISEEITAKNRQFRKEQELTKVRHSQDILSHEAGEFRSLLADHLASGSLADQMRGLGVRIHETETRIREQKHQIAILDKNKSILARRIEQSESDVIASEEQIASLTVQKGRLFELADQMHLAKICGLENQQALLSQGFSFRYCPESMRIPVPDMTEESLFRELTEIQKHWRKQQQDFKKFLLKCALGGNGMDLRDVNCDGFSKSQSVIVRQIQQQNEQSFRIHLRHLQQELTLRLEHDGRIRSAIDRLINSKNESEQRIGDMKRDILGLLRMTTTIGNIGPNYNYSVTYNEGAPQSYRVQIAEQTIRKDLLLEDINFQELNRRLAMKEIEEGIRCSVEEFREEGKLKNLALEKTASDLKQQIQSLLAEIQRDETEASLEETRQEREIRVLQARVISLRDQVEHAELERQLHTGKNELLNNEIRIYREKINRSLLEIEIDQTELQKNAIELQKIVETAERLQEQAELQKQRMEKLKDIASTGAGYMEHYRDLSGEIKELMQVQHRLSLGLKQDELESLLVTLNNEENSAAIRLESAIRDQRRALAKKDIHLSLQHEKLHLAEAVRDARNKILELSEQRMLLSAAGAVEKYALLEQREWQHSLMECSLSDLVARKKSLISSVNRKTGSLLQKLRLASQVTRGISFVDVGSTRITDSGAVRLFLSRLEGLEQQFPPVQVVRITIPSESSFVENLKNYGYTDFSIAPPAMHGAGNYTEIAGGGFLNLWPVSQKVADWFNESVGLQLLDIRLRLGSVPERDVKPKWELTHKGQGWTFADTGEAIPFVGSPKTVQRSVDYQQLRQESDEELNRYNLGSSVGGWFQNTQAFPGFPLIGNYSLKISLPQLMAASDSVHMYLYFFTKQ